MKSSSTVPSYPQKSVSFAEGVKNHDGKRPEPDHFSTILGDRLTKYLPKLMALVAENEKQNMKQPVPERGRILKKTGKRIRKSKQRRRPKTTTKVRSDNPPDKHSKVLQTEDMNLSKQLGSETRDATFTHENDCNIISKWKPPPKATHVISDSSSYVFLVQNSFFDFLRNTNSFSCNRELSIKSNLFFLLSKYGSQTRIADLMSDDEIIWSNDRYWYLCGIMPNGFPWKIPVPIKMKTLAEELLSCQTEDLMEIERNQKLLKVNMIDNLQTFLSEEWVSFDFHRQQTLNFLGFCAIGNRLSRRDRFSQGNAFNPYQGLVWEKNSCAYDAFFAIIPTIAVSCIHDNVYSAKVLGCNSLHFAPVAKLIAAFDVLESESDFSPMTISRWVRQLGIEIISSLNGQEYLSKNSISWSTFSSSNEFCDIGALFGILSIFFGSKTPVVQSVGAPTVIEVSPFIFHEELSYSCGTKKTSNNFAKILFNSILNERLEANQPLEAGIYVLSCTLSSKRDAKVAFWFPSLLLTPWSGTFVIPRRFSLYNRCKKWFLRLVAITSTALSDHRHFVSATCHYTPDQNLHYHDGMKEDGKVRKLTAEDIIDSRMSLKNAFFVAVVRPHS